MFRSCFVALIRSNIIKSSTFSAIDRQVQIFKNVTVFSLRHKCLSPSNVFPRRHYNEAYHGILWAGILSFLGLEKDPEEKESELIIMIKRGILCIQREEYKKAEQMLHLALKIAQEHNNSEGVTYIFDVLANLAFDTGDFVKAEKLFINVLQRLISTGVQQDDNKVIHISLKLARIYQEQKDNLKAEEGFKFCLQHLEKKVSVESELTEDTWILWAMSLDWYARYLVTTNRATEAFKYFKMAYDTCIKVHGKEHEQAVVLLNDLGTVSSTMGNTDAALNYLQEATTIGKTLPDMEDLGSIYVNLGQVYLIKEMYAESKSACELGLNHARKYDNKDGVKEAISCLDKLKTTFVV